jgi:hypothetical protein
VFNGSSKLIVSEVQVVDVGPEPVPKGRGLVGKAWVTLAALLIGLMLILLQLIGLGYAVQGRRVLNMKAIWCSPMFRASVAVSSNCELFPVLLSASNGIGCIRLPAVDQYRWLTATVAILSLCLVLELVDGFILVSVSNHASCWRGARLKRPWFTMIAGNVILVVILIGGIFMAIQLPREVNKYVSVFKYEASINASTVCAGELLSPGVRGSIIGWTDGFLHSWGEAYQGSP